MSGGLWGHPGHSTPETYAAGTGERPAEPPHPRPVICGGHKGRSPSNLQHASELGFAQNGRVSSQPKTRGVTFMLRIYASLSSAFANFLD